ncbi:phosphonate C-P lyase system protein PhnH [Limoniibacter endophyticus]|uniref:Carbon-phosphorus lyase subunit PhnH n=1 Tax=Limoniibacter endophyticus TaxID=1565040 RepID=A0A8J3DL75_9HYPH|nr:phosphonate C-P lyase system protein PhnH [Limoniibacter endophyticus]GHC66846.1 carbon-phosphorus lyase subunit PhnH [Limoniibacter endophyticus]
MQTRASEQTIEGGLVDPVMELQAGFRAIMGAMAQPGTVHRSDTSAKPPLPLTPLAALAALTLCDYDTTLWLDADLDTQVVRAWLGFHCGTSIVDDKALADFVLTGDAMQLSDLAAFAPGEQEFPDRSATLIVQVPSLSGGQHLRLNGPGIRTFSTASPKGLPENFVAQWEGNNARFPLGVDLILCGPEGFLSIPRTTRINLLEV